MTNMLSPAASWQAMPSLPEGCGNFAFGVWDKDMVLFGGVSWRNETKTFRDSVWRFHSASQRWTQAGQMPHPLAYASFGQTGEHLFIAGGSDGKTNQAEFVVWDRQLKARTLAAVPRPLVYSGSSLAQGKLFVVCGAGDPLNLATVTNSFYSIVLKTGQAELLPPYPDAVIVPATAALGDCLFVFGGGRILPSSQVQNTDQAFVYSISERKWTPIRPYPLAARGMAACVLDERYILLGGGYETDFLDAEFIYDTRTGAYHRAQPLPYRAMANYIKVGEDLFWLGGEDKMKHRSELVYRIDWRSLLPDRSIK